MYRIALINMPFASVALPSIALTQLKSVLEMELGDEVDAKIFYPNHDFALAMGVELYRGIADSVDAVSSGLGDWFFRPLAFPDLEDNAEDYLTRHFSDRRQELERVRGPLLEARQQSGPLLRQLIDRYELDSFSLVGLSSMFSQNLACLALAKELKQRRPEIVTVMGGANCETPMGQVLAKNFEPVDFVFSGPSLKNFPQLVRCLIAGEEEKSHNVPGAFSRRNLAGEGAENLPKAGPELDIDVDVSLDFDGFLSSFEKSFADSGVEPVLSFETSRGCWWGERSHCTFCGLNGLTMKYRSMAPEKALELLQDLFDRYGSRVRRFQSVDNILPRQYLTDLLPRLRPPEKASIFYEVKADLKDREMAVMAEAGVTQIQPGIEALATSTLKLMKKGTTSFQNLRFLKSCSRYDIEPHWNLLIGFPDEQEDVYKKYFSDLPLLVHLPPPSGVFPVRFDRYSPYFTGADGYDLKLQPADFYRMIYPFEAQDLEQLAYYFSDQNYNASYLMATARWIGKLRQRVDYWHTRFHQRDRGLKPTLELEHRGESRVVVDTRSGMAVEHDINPAGLRILELLTKPMRLSRLATKLAAEELESVSGGTVSEPALKSLVTALKGRGLIFQENNLYMSLVMDSESVAEQPWVQPKGAERSDDRWSGTPATLVG